MRFGLFRTIHGFLQPWPDPDTGSPAVASDPGPASPAPEARVPCDDVPTRLDPHPPSALAGFPLNIAEEARHRRSRTGGVSGGPAHRPSRGRAGRETVEKIRPPLRRDSGGRSSLTPGPIVELSDTFLMKVPLAPPVWRLDRADQGPTLAAIASSLNEALPTPAWTMPAFSARNSIEPALAALTAAVTSWGHRCRGAGWASGRAGPAPAEPADHAHHVGVAMQRSKLISPALDLRRGPRRRPRRHRPPWPRRPWPGRTPRPAPTCRCRWQFDHAAHHLVGMARVDAQVHGDLDRLVELWPLALALTSFTASPRRRSCRGRPLAERP